MKSAVPKAKHGMKKKMAKNKQLLCLDVFAGEVPDAIGWNGKKKREGVKKGCAAKSVYFFSCVIGECNSSRET